MPLFIENGLFMQLFYLGLHLFYLFLELLYLVFFPLEILRHVLYVLFADVL